MSKIPAGATHEGKGECKFYVKDLIPGESFSFCNERTDGGFTPWKKSINSVPDYPITPIVREWNGPEDGLPPVGLEFEWRYAGGDWKKGEALYIGSIYAVLKSADSEQHYYLRDMQFRPSRTAEQLAAEEHRAKYMRQLIKLWDADTDRSEFLEAVYAMIVEAGKP